MSQYSQLLDRNNLHQFDEDFNPRLESMNIMEEILINNQNTFKKEIELEYCELNNEDTSVLNEGFISSIIEGVKAFFRKIGELLSNFGKWITGFFSKSSSDNSSSKTTSNNNNDIREKLKKVRFEEPKKWVIGSRMLEKSTFLRYYDTINMGIQLDSLPDSKLKDVKNKDQFVEFIFSSVTISGITSEKELLEKIESYCTETVSQLNDSMIKDILRLDDIVDSIEKQTKEYKNFFNKVENGILSDLKNGNPNYVNNMNQIIKFAESVILDITNKFMYLSKKAIKDYNYVLQKVK